MRIGLLIYGDLASLSGGYLYNRKLVDYLQRQGDRVEILSLPPRSFVRNLADNFDTALYTRIRDAKLDLLILDAMIHPSLWLLNRRLRRHLGIPLIALVHLLANYEDLPWVRSVVQCAVERRFLGSVDGFIANSQTTWAQIQSLLDGLDLPHCIAYPAGDHFSNVQMDADAVQRRALEPGPLKILAVGNVIRRKGLHVLVEALGHWPQREFQVSIIGRLDMEERYVAQLQAQIRKLNLRDSVQLLGPVQGETLAQIYATHHLLVLPSRYESFGIVYLEAQQFGLPAIGTTDGAAREVIQDGQNGFLLDPDDAAGLVSLLQSLHRDRAKLAQLGHNALTHFTSFPRWEQSCERIRKFLYTMCESRPSPS